MREPVTFRELCWTSGRLGTSHSLVGCDVNCVFVCAYVCSTHFLDCSSLGL